MKTEIKKLYLVLMALLVSMSAMVASAALATPWPDKLYLIETSDNNNAAATLTPTGGVYKVSNVKMYNGKYYTIASATGDWNNDINNSYRIGPTVDGTELKANVEQDVVKNTGPSWKFASNDGNYDITVDFNTAKILVVEHSDIPITEKKCYYSWKSNDSWVEMTNNGDGTYTFDVDVTTKGNTDFIFVKDYDGNTYGESGSNQWLKDKENYTPAKNAQYGVYFDKTGKATITYTPSSNTLYAVWETVVEPEPDPVYSFSYPYSENANAVFTAMTKEGDLYKFTITKASDNRLILANSTTPSNDSHYIGCTDSDRNITAKGANKNMQAGVKNVAYVMAGETGKELTFTFNPTTNVLTLTDIEEDEEEVGANNWYIRWGKSNGSNGTAWQTVWTKLTRRADGTFTFNYPTAYPNEWQCFAFSNFADGHKYWGGGGKNKNLTAFDTPYSATEYEWATNSDNGIYVDPANIKGNNVMFTWNPKNHTLTATKREGQVLASGPYYFCGDLNQWQLAESGNSFKKLDGTVISQDEFKAMWQFQPVDESDGFDEGWYKLVVPATDAHKKLCAQFKINKGRWNDGDNQGNEWTVNFAQSTDDMEKSKLHYYLDFIEGDYEGELKDQPWELLRQRNLIPLKEENGKYYEKFTEEECRATSTEIITRYFVNQGLSAHNFADIHDAANQTQLVQRLSTNASKFDSNMHLTTNAIVPAEGMDNVVIYFFPGYQYDNALLNDQAKIVILGENKSYYMYYVNADDTDETEHKVFVNIKNDNELAENYFVDRTVNMGNFEHVKDDVITVNGVDYTNFYRKPIGNGYEHRMTQKGSGAITHYTATFTVDGEIKSVQTIECNDVVLFESTKTYDVQLAVRGHDKTISNVNMYVCRPNSGASKLLDAKTLTSDVDFNTMRNNADSYAVKMIAPAEGEEYWTIAEADRLLSVFGESYLVFEAVNSDGSKTYFWYNPDNEGGNQMSWIKMNNSDKKVIVNLSAEAADITALLFSHLSGDAATGEELMVNVVVEGENGELLEHSADIANRPYKFGFGVSATAGNANTVDWSSDTTEPFGKVTLPETAGTYYIYVRVASTAEGAGYAFAYAPFEVKASVDSKQLSVGNLTHFEANLVGCDVDGCEAPKNKVIDVQAQTYISHLHAVIEGELANGATVEWQKFNNGKPQGYYGNIHDTDTDEWYTGWIDVEEHGVINCGENMTAHSTLNFGDCLYRVIVTPAATAQPTAVRADGPQHVVAGNVKALDTPNKVAYSYVVKDQTTGVESVVTDGDVDAEPVYYNLQGIRVAEPVHGTIYIEVRGAKTRKVIL